jgi:hypothetical protein
MLLLFSESSGWVGVHRLDLRLFGEVQCESYWLLNHFSQWKLSKIKTENCIGIWGHSWCCWKALDESNLMEFISQFLKLTCERYWFLQKLQKLGLEGKNQLSPQCVHTWAKGTRYASNGWNEDENVKKLKKDLFEQDVNFGMKQMDPQCWIHGSINANGSKLLKFINNKIWNDLKCI